MILIIGILWRSIYTLLVCSSKKRQVRQNSYKKRKVKTKKEAEISKFIIKPHQQHSRQQTESLPSLNQQNLNR